MCQITQHWEGRVLSNGNRTVVGDWCDGGDMNNLEEGGVAHWGHGRQCLQGGHAYVCLTHSLSSTVPDSMAVASSLLTLHMTTIPQWGGSAVKNLIVTLFRVLGYTKCYCITLTWTWLSLLTCGKHQHTQTDISIIDCNQNNIFLVVKVEEHFKEGRGGDPKAQLIAEALAAFVMINELRINTAVDPLDAKVCTIICFLLSYYIHTTKVMSGIVIKGMVPRFYKIPITMDLLQHVAHGTYPPNPIHVTFCSIE
jgi:hypothetical protein